MSRPKKPLKVLIVAGGSDPQSLALYDDTWRVWGINSIHRRIPGEIFAGHTYHRMFNLHRLVHLERDCPQYVDWDTTYSRRHPKVPFYVVDNWKGLLTNQVLFPRRALAEQPRSDYHASSIDWLVALAVHERAHTISIHGARFALDAPGEEPISAQACLEYWCGYAEGRGISVAGGGSSELFYQYHLVRSLSVYGYDDVRMVEDRRRLR